MESSMTPGSLSREKYIQLDLIIPLSLGNLRIPIIPLFGAIAI